MENLKDDLEMMKEKFHENHGMTAEELVDTDFEIFVTSTSSDADILAEVSGHADIDNEEQFQDEEQPTDCISKPAFKDVVRVNDDAYMYIYTVYFYLRKNTTKNATRFGNKLSNKTS